MVFQQIITQMRYVWYLAKVTHDLDALLQIHIIFQVTEITAKVEKNLLSRHANEVMEFENK